MNMKRWAAACAVGLAVASAAARTVALWPLGSSNGNFDGSCAVDPRNVLTLSANYTAVDGETPGNWNLPPNIGDTNQYLFVPTAYSSAGSTSASSHASPVLSSTEHSLAAYLVPTNDFTVEGWIRFDEVVAKGKWHIIAQSGNGSGGASGWCVSLRRPSSDLILNLYVQNGARTGAVVNDRSLGTLVSTEEEDSFVGTWHHYAIVFKYDNGSGKSQWTVYFDGTALATSPTHAQNPPTVATSDLFELGGRSNAAQRMKGAISYWRVSDEALAPKDFLNYDPDSVGGTTVPECVSSVTTNTVAYWPLGVNDDGTLDTMDHVGTADLSTGLQCPIVTDSSTGVALTNSCCGFSPSMDCAFTGNPPNPNVDLGSYGNAGSFLGRRDCDILTADVGKSSFYVPRLGSLLEPATSSFTVESWVKPRRDQADNPQSVQFVFSTRISNKGWALEYIPSSGKFVIFLADDSGDIIYNQPLNSESLADSWGDAWHHLALVYENGAGSYGYGEWRLYLDGELTGSRPIPRAFDGTTESAWFCLGGRRGGNSMNWNGHLDCVRVCGAALSPEQFLCATGTTAKAATDVLALWPLNVADGYRMDGTDVTGNYSLNQPLSDTEYLLDASDESPVVTNPDTSTNFMPRTSTRTGSITFTKGRKSALGTSSAMIRTAFAAHPWTFEAWCRRTSADANSTVGDMLFVLPANDFPADVWSALRMVFSYTPSGFRLEDNMLTSGGPFTFPASLTLEAWHHVALVCTPASDATTATYEVFLDGETVGSTNATLRGSVGRPERLYFGGRPNNAGNTWPGQLAHVRISSAALTTNEFLNASGTAEPTAESGTLAFWPLDNSEGAADISARVGLYAYNFLSSSSGVSGSSDAAATRVPLSGVSFDRANSGSVALASSDWALAYSIGLKASLSAAFTVEGWFKWDSDAESGARYSLCGTYSDGAGWKLLLDDTGDAPCFRVYARAGSVFTPCVDSCFTGMVNTVSRGVWTHVALAYDPDVAGGTWELWIDGRSAGTVRNIWRQAGAPGTGRDFHLGALEDDFDAGLEGLFDMWRISKGVLTAEEFLRYTPSGCTIIIR